MSIGKETTIAHVRQSQPDYGLAFHVEVLETFQVVASSLGSRNPQPESGHLPGVPFRAGEEVIRVPLSSQLGTNKTVMARSWPWLEPFYARNFQPIQVVSSSLTGGALTESDPLKAVHLARHKWTTLINL